MLTVVYKIKKNSAKTMWLRVLVFALLFMVAMAFVSCSNEENQGAINKDNIGLKLEEAFDLLINNSDEELGKEVVQYIEANTVSLKKPKHKGLAIYFIGHKNLILNLYDKARPKFFEAIKIFDAIGASAESAECYNEISLTHTYQKEYDSALKYLLLGLSKIDPEKFPEMVIDMKYNLALCYLRMKRFDDALEATNSAIALINKYNVKIDNLKILYRNLAIYEHKEGNYESAKKYLDIAISGPCETECLMTKRIFYIKYAEIFIDQGDHVKANEYYAKAIAIYAETFREKEKKFVNQVRKEVELKLELKKEVKNKLARQRLILYAILAFLGISILYTMAILNQRKKVNKAMQEINELNIKLQNTVISKDIANLDLENKKNEVQGLLDLNERSLFSKELKLSTIRENILKIAEEISKLAESDSVIKPNYLFGIEKKLQTVITDEGLWSDFKMQFEQIRPDFFKKLKKLHPNLSVNDMKHCSYIVSNLKNKDVANLINVSTRSVETARYRIKKKLNLEKGEDLYSYLQRI